MSPSVLVVYPHVSFEAAAATFTASARRSTRFTARRRSDSSFVAIAFAMGQPASITALSVPVPLPVPVAGALWPRSRVVGHSRRSGRKSGHGHGHGEDAMYGWGDDTSDWATPGVYKFDAGSAKARSADAERAAAGWPRTYHDEGRPNTQLTDPKKMISSSSKDPLLVAVDVTGSM